MTTVTDAPVKSRYEKLVAHRDPFLRRAQKCSELTLPFLIPPDGHTSSNSLPTPFQSVGGRGVSTLAAKLLLALLPPGDSFFRLKMDKQAREELTAGDKEAISEVEKALKDLENIYVGELESSNARAALFEALKLLVVSGNVLLYIKPEGGIQFFKLNQYVTKRDPAGRVLEIITLQLTHPTALTPEVRSACDCLTETEPVELYTSIKLSSDGSQYSIEQEIKGIKVPNSEGFYPTDLSPWLALRWQHIDGEDYGRGLCEELLGDLISLEELSKAIVTGAAAAAKIIFMVRSGSITKATDLTEAESGDFVTGSANDVSVLQLDKYADFRTALEFMQRIEERLAAAFLLRESVQRDAERVTAEEIRFMATELDDALGGVFSILAQELQLPLVKRLRQNLEKAGRLPTMPKGAIEPVVVTGLDALGRTNDLMKLDRLVQGLFELDPTLADKYVSIREYIQRRAVALGVDSEGIVRTDEEVAAKEQQEQQAAMAAQLGPQAIQQAGNMATAAVQGGQ
jgi:hypothetical protein